MTEDEQLDFDGLADSRGKEGEKRPRKTKTKKANEPAEAASDLGLAGKSSLASQETNADAEPEPAPATTEDAATLAPGDRPVVMEDEPDRAAEPMQATAFFLTNTMNLNGVLSSRMLAPRESFHKYYDDLLELAPGWVPILKGPPPRSLLKKVTVEKGAGTPVLIELSESVLAGQPSNSVVTYLKAGLLADARAVHFPDEKSLREHRARGFSNVHPHDHLLRVSPELFASEAETEISIEPPSQAPVVDWLRLDRIRGALSAAFSASGNGEALAITAGILGASAPPDGITMPPWLIWAGLTGDPPTPVTETGAEQADRLIFQSAYSVLGESDQTKSWSSSEVLESVAAAVAAAEPMAEAQASIDRTLQRLREIVNVERDFEPFRNPSSPHVAAKALLMVLLRPDLEELLRWSSAETGADDTTRLVAAVLAGSLRGLARESVNLRSREVDDLTARWAVRTATGHEDDLGRVEFVANDARTALLLDDREVATSTPLVPDPVPLYESLDSAVRGDVRLAVARAFGWPVQMLVHLPDGADVRQEDGKITIASTESPAIETAVDESDFVERLQALTGLARREAVRALTR